MIGKILVLSFFLWPGAAKDPVIVEGSRFSNYEENEPFMKGNPISPAEAEKRVELYIKENPDPKLPKEAGSFEGMLNDEYLFSMVGGAHKHGFVLYGYRVNVKDGSVRFVDRHIASAELGGKFPKGYIPFGVGELKKYLAKKPPKKP